MNIVIVSPHIGPVAFDGSHLELNDANIFLRCLPSGLKSLQMDLVVFLPGCTEKQKALGTERTRACNGKVVDLDPA